MTARFIAPRVPVVDAQGIANPIWYRFFSDLFSNAGTGSVSNSEAFDVSPMQDYAAAQFYSLAVADPLLPVAQAAAPFADPLIPASPSAAPFPDDLSPSLHWVLAEIAMLRAEIDDLRKGTLA